MLHKIMSSTCQTIQCHYDASQYRVYIPVYNFVFVIPKSQWQGPRCVLFCALYTDTGKCPPYGTSLEVYLPPYLPFSRAPLPRSVAPSLLRFLPPSPISLAPSMPEFLPQPFIHSCSHPPSHHRFLTPSPCSLLPSSILPCLPPAVQFNVHRMCVWQAAL